jgi:hypothetical protein
MWPTPTGLAMATTSILISLSGRYGVIPRARQQWQDRESGKSQPEFLSWAIDGKCTALAADDSPLVLRDTSVDEIYALDWDAQ